MQVLSCEINNTHREKLNLVQEFIQVKSCLLLIFLDVFMQFINISDFHSVIIVKFYNQHSFIINKGTDI